MDISFRMEKISMLAKNQHPILKIICFRTFFYCFFIWAFRWGLNFFYFFKKLYIWINRHSRMEKIYLHAKNQHPIFKFIHLRTVFLIPQRRDFNLNLQKLQTSIKSVILGLGIKQNLFWNHQSINFMKITTRNTGTKLC